MNTVSFSPVKAMADALFQKSVKAKVKDSVLKYSVSREGNSAKGVAAIALALFGVIEAFFKVATAPLALIGAAIEAAAKGCKDKQTIYCTNYLASTNISFTTTMALVASLCQPGITPPTIRPKEEGARPVVV